MYAGEDVSHIATLHALWMQAEHVRARRRKLRKDGVRERIEVREKVERVK